MERMISFVCSMCMLEIQFVNICNAIKGCSRLSVISLLPLVVAGISHGALCAVRGGYRLSVNFGSSLSLHST
jgi:hypothetical protein